MTYVLVTALIFGATVAAWLALTALIVRFHRWGQSRTAACGDRAKGRALTELHSGYSPWLKAMQQADQERTRNAAIRRPGGAGPMERYE